MTPIPEAHVDAAATAMLTPQMRRILHAAGMEYEPGSVMRTNRPPEPVSAGKAAL